MNNSVSGTSSINPPGQKNLERSQSSASAPSQEGQSLMRRMVNQVNPKGSGHVGKFTQATGKAGAKVLAGLGFKKNTQGAPGPNASASKTARAKNALNSFQNLFKSMLTKAQAGGSKLAQSSPVVKAKGQLVQTGQWIKESLVGRSPEAVYHAARGNSDIAGQLTQADQTTIEQHTKNVETAKQARKRALLATSKAHAFGLAKVGLLAGLATGGAAAIGVLIAKIFAASKKPSVPEEDTETLEDCPDLNPNAQDFSELKVANPEVGEGFEALFSMTPDSEEKAELIKSFKEDLNQYPSEIRGAVAEAALESSRETLEGFKELVDGLEGSNGEIDVKAAENALNHMVDNLENHPEKVFSAMHEEGFKAALASEPDPSKADVAEEISKSITKDALRQGAIFGSVLGASIGGALLLGKAFRTQRRLQSTIPVEVQAGNKESALMKEAQDLLRESKLATSKKEAHYQSEVVPLLSRIEVLQRGGAPIAGNQNISPLINVLKQSVASNPILNSQQT